MKDLTADSGSGNNTGPNEQQQEKPIRLLYEEDGEEAPGKTPPRTGGETPPRGSSGSESGSPGSAADAGSGDKSPPASTPQEGHIKTPNLKENTKVNKAREKTFSVTNMRKELEVVGTGSRNKLIDEVFIGSPPPGPRHLRC
jgi:hypothetical protein